jgi:hypothetical protein
MKNRTSANTIQSQGKTKWQTKIPNPNLKYKEQTKTIILSLKSSQINCLGSQSLRHREQLIKQSNFVALVHLAMRLKNCNLLKVLNFQDRLAMIGMK